MADKITDRNVRRLRLAALRVIRRYYEGKLSPVDVNELQDALGPVSLDQRAEARR